MKRHRAKRALDPYRIRVGGIIVDPYLISILYDLDPVLAAAVKKLLRAGRKHKRLGRDVAECISTLRRWQRIQRDLRRGLGRRRVAGGKGQRGAIRRRPGVLRSPDPQRGRKQRRITRGSRPRARKQALPAQTLNTR